MNSRERVRLALNHQEPDRVPIDLGSNEASGISATAYDRLWRYLGLPPKRPKVWDVMQMLAWVDQPIIERFGIDTLIVPTLIGTHDVRIDGAKPWNLADGTPVDVPAAFETITQPDGTLLLISGGVPVAAMPKGGYYFDPLIEATSTDLPDIDSLVFQSFTDEDLRFCEDYARELFEGTDKALVGRYPYALRRWGSLEDWLVAVAGAPEYVREFNERKIENLMDNMRLYAQAVGPYLDIVQLGHDFGTQNCPLISPRQFRDLMLPYYKRLFGWVHENTNWKVMLHCCGSIILLIPLFVECGVDVLNPVQCTAANMDPRVLKREFGKDLVFWGGGIDTQTVLPFGTPGDVRRQVRERLQIFGPGGGFIFNPTHNIQRDAPPENVVAMFDTALEYGRYPIEGI